MHTLFPFKIVLLTFLIIIFLTPSKGLSQEFIKKNRTSLFDHIYQIEGTPRIVIETNVKKLIAKKMTEVYQETSFQLIDQIENDTLLLTGRIRARGNIRKRVSYLPPVKIDFKKSILDSLGFLKLDKLKFVFPMNRSTQSQNRLFKEFFLYELYEQLDSSSIRAKLVDISIIYKEKEKYHFTAFMIEDEEEYARRNNAKIVERGKLISSALDRKSFLKMVFFQYMIANTDYSVANKHNLEIVKLPNVKRVVAVPYDFDYSGFVGQQYAIPYDVFPIESVHERYLFSGYRISESEYTVMVNYFIEKEKDIIASCENANYMNSKSIKECKNSLSSFFKLLRKPKNLKSHLVKR